MIDRLAKRETGDLPFAVHSDPEHKLLLQPHEENYVKLQQPAKEKFGGDYTDYEMVQPALEILDKTGAIVQKWSWHSFDPKPDFNNVVDLVKGSDGEEIKLVVARPQTDDIVSAIKEGRPVKIHAAMQL